MSLKKAAKEIERDQIYARIKRVNWIFMAERIETELKKIKIDTLSESKLGNLYLSKSDNHLMERRRLLSYQYINSIHIYTGNRLLDLFIPNKDETDVMIARERNAQLWYSQGPSGEVIVFVSPYESDLGKFDENEIIIGKYTNPYQINEAVIIKHFSIFFKYCVCTSQHSAAKFTHYFYRQYLIFNDFRYRSTYIKKFIRNGERVVLVAFTVAAVLVAIYLKGSN
ncbi:hypothetical protein KDV32_09355 [Morganella morganii]|nr:hypothetical protein [Morganella morganii subsp. morganii]MBT0414537.1 hypothetical protein [Morganella morganii subsp. morganii]MBT0443145.1 hypothetical protein [Morganella morganii subsp. morganii]HCR4152292.1 hypothetical protein [Morganella morganii]HEI7977837.1 hypothetical protein [Morganella morganii]